LTARARGSPLYKADPGPRRLSRHLTTSKKLLTFTEEEGADAHCHPDALRLAVARIFDWLDDTI